MSSIFQSTADAIKAPAETVRVKLAPVPAFADIAKATNDLLNKDFYHVAAANLEVKSKAPNGVAYTVKGKSAHSGGIAASLEGKFADKANGLTGTATWTSINAIDVKVEAEDNLIKGLKAEALATFKPEAQSAPAAGKLNLYFKEAQYNVRAFADLLKGPAVNADVVLGHGGFVVGAEAGYDVKKAALTRWSLAAGYLSPAHSAAVTSSNNLSIFTASFFHKVNGQIQAGAKATYDSKNAGSVGLELATRYQLDPVTFTKAKINDRGVAAVSYNTLIRPGFTFGVGASFDTQKLNEATHTVGTHFAFEA